MTENNLTQLGNHNTQYSYDNPSIDMLEVFNNQYIGRHYETQFKFPEFTSLCPKTGQPDFATIVIKYVPDRYCIETKSLKLYFLAYRNYGSFMETIVNKILEDCAQVCNPHWMKVIGNFNARGGTKIKVTAET